MDARATLEQLPPGARGIVFQLCESLGVLPRRPIEQQMAELGEEDRKALAKLGGRVGVYSLYFPSMPKPGPVRPPGGLRIVAGRRSGREQGWRGYRRRTQGGEASGRGAEGRNGGEVRTAGARSAGGQACSAQAIAAGLVPRDAADDVAGRLLGAGDGGRVARPRVPRPSADRRDRPAA